jgi:lysozyme
MRANRALLVLVALVIVAAGCGSSDDSTPVTVTPTTASDAYATTVPAVTTTQASYSTTAAPTTAAASVTTTLPPATMTEPPDTGPRTVTVKAGDSLSQIAKDNGMTLDELATLNAICDTNQLFVDQVLLLSAEEADDPDAEPSEQTIMVQSGDSLSKIAKRHDTSVEALIADNDIDDPNTILVGQELVVFSDAPVTPTEDPCD